MIIFTLHGIHFFIIIFVSYFPYHFALLMHICFYNFLNHSNFHGSSLKQTNHKYIVFVCFLTLQRTHRMASHGS